MLTAWLTAYRALTPAQQDTLRVILWDGQGTSPFATAPSFTDPTGDPLTTRVGESETVTVPAPEGNPTPTLAVVGSLPDGVTFMPGATPSYVTVPLPRSKRSALASTRLAFRDDTNGLGSVDALRASAFLNFIQIWGTRTSFQVRVGDTLPAPIGGTGQELPVAWEMGLESIIFQCDGLSDLVLPGPDNPTNRSRDSSEWYAFTPSDAKVTESAAWITAYRALTDAQQDTARVILWDGKGPDPRVSGSADAKLTVAPTKAATGTITIRATNSQGTADWTVDYNFRPPLAKPAFANPTGTPLTTKVGSSEQVTVPLATGEPPPTYAVVGSLPAGVTFDATMRELTVAPTTVASGTITIRATNSQGTADWRVRYDFRPAQGPPDVKIQTMSATVESGEGVQLAATATDPDFDTVTVKWSAPQGSFSNDAILNPVWTAPVVGEDTTVKLTLTGRDPGGRTDTASIIFTVRALAQAGLAHTWRGKPWDLAFRRASSSKLNKITHAWAHIAEGATPLLIFGPLKGLGLRLTPGVRGMRADWLHRTDVKDYMVAIGLEATGAELEKATLAGDATQHPFSGLEPDTEYFVTLLAQRTGQNLMDRQVASTLAEDQMLDVRPDDSIVVEIRPEPLTPRIFMADESVIVELRQEAIVDRQYHAADSIVVEIQRESDVRGYQAADSIVVEIQPPSQIRDYHAADSIVVELQRETGVAQWATPQTVTVSG